MREWHYSALVYLNDPQRVRLLDPSGKQQQQDGDHHPSNYHKAGFEGGDLVFKVPPFLWSQGRAGVGTAAPGGCSSSTTTTNNNIINNNNTGDASTRAAPRTPCIRPRASRAVCFPSSSDYVHGVQAVTGEKRYALTMWFTRKKEAIGNPVTGEPATGKTLNWKSRNWKAPATVRPSSNNSQLVIIKLNIQAK